MNAITAEATLNSRATRPRKTSFGQCFQIKPFSDSLLFWVFSCKHFCKRLPSFKKTNTGLIVPLMTEGNPGFSLCLFHLVYRIGIYTSCPWYLGTFYVMYLNQMLQSNEIKQLQQLFCVGRQLYLCFVIKQDHDKFVVC